MQIGEHKKAPSQRFVNVLPPRERPASRALVLTYTSNRLDLFLRAADADKKLVSLDGGRVPALPNEVIREVLGWLGGYLRVGRDGELTAPDPGRA